MTLGHFQNFPTNLHQIETFTTTLSTRRLQQMLLQVLQQANCKEFSFEEVTNPTIPSGRVIFEFGIAEDEGFNFIDEAEFRKATDFVAKTHVATMDFFCSIRYYKLEGEKKLPLKFDYFMFKFTFAGGTLEVSVFHERGPRYISPEELVAFIFNNVNHSSKHRKVLNRMSV